MIIVHRVLVSVDAPTAEDLIAAVAATKTKEISAISISWESSASDSRKTYAVADITLWVAQGDTCEAAEKRFKDAFFKAVQPLRRAAKALDRIGEGLPTTLPQA